MKLSLVFICLFASFVACSQTKNLGSWSVINTKVTLSKKWGLFNELQVRSQSFYDDLYYYEIKGGVSYSINKNFSFLAGIGKYMTYANKGNFKKPVAAEEFRNWQQLTMNHYLERIKFEHRYRVEQRWFKTGYRNRFRYRLNALVPINRKKMEAKTFYASAFNELFLTNKSPYFERNRFFAGVGYKFSEQVTLQPGYAYQFDYRSDGTKFPKHFVQITLMLEFGSSKNTNERIPGSLD
jgi:long-subunit fatty acid transport protein